MNKNADFQGGRSGESLNREVKRRVDLLCCIGEKLGEVQSAPRSAYWKVQVNKTLQKVEELLPLLESSRDGEVEKYLYRLRRLQGELKKLTQPF